MTTETKVPQIDVDKFWRDGYIIVKNALTEEQVRVLREAAEQSKNTGNAQRDLLNNPSTELRQLVSHPTLIHAAKQLLGETPVYYGDSSITYGSFHRGWHKDNRIPDRFKHNYSDWIGRHTMLRFGLYLQDHSRHSGGLAIRVGSHRPNRLVNKLQGLKLPMFATLKNERIKTRLQIIASQHYGSAKLLNSERGDLLIWNQTTTHSGNALRLKLMSNTKLPTWVENSIPDKFTKPYEKDRISIFLAYAKYDDHLKRGLEFLKTRDYMTRKWEIYKESTYLSSENLRILNYSDIYKQ